VSVFLDRMMGVIGLSALFVIGALIGLPPGLRLNGPTMIADVSSWVVLAGFTTTIVVVATVSIVTRRPGLWSSFTRRLPKIDWSAWSGRQGLKRLVNAYGVTVVSHLIAVAGYWFLLHGIQVDVGIGTVIWLVLAATLSMLFPISINGLGVQEATYVVVLGAYGVTNTAALVASFVARLMMLLLALAGGCGWLLARPTAQDTANVPRA
jgi:uncharacterized membrane protein YbhN (UPF0104 family)